MADDELLYFCPACFASERDGSHGCTCIDVHCYNCGLSAPMLQIPGWAIERIRRSASWVGKRFYPDSEDREMGIERADMRSQLPLPPGRVAQRCDPGDPYSWKVSQALSKGGTVSVFVQARSMEEALQLSKTALPWVRRFETDLTH